ncbi:helix-turn-helix transcriptional regulator [soil metagenome]
MVEIRIVVNKHMTYVLITHIMFVALTRNRNTTQTFRMERNLINVAFGKAVAVRRDELGLTQADLASIVGLSRASIANIERGRQNVLLHHVYDLATALKMTKVGDLLPARPQPNKAPRVEFAFSDPLVSPHSAAQLTDLVAAALAAREPGKAGA